MSDCHATATILLGGRPTVVICNLPAGHASEEHEDVVLGNWHGSDLPPNARQWPGGD
ncbi:hypothetical protein [Kitasatospora sp. NPDC050543]|uniref:hypothetical protein n=1 Tax=Kitasatospora sp. NPDC050543 TaxID=3364054 RepID=UPI003787928E